MKIQKKKFMNFRLFLILAIVMLISSIMITKVFVSQNLKLWTILILGVLAIATFVCLLIFKKKFIAVFLLGLICAIVPATSVYFRAEAIEQNKSLNVEKCFINGKIYKTDENLEENTITILLSDVKLRNGFEELDFYGKFRVKLSVNNVDTSKVVVGNYVTVLGDVSFYSLYDGEYLSSISKGINASTRAYSYTFWVEEKTDLNLRDRVKASVYNLFSKVDLLFAGVGYAMIFGEVSSVNDVVYDVFKGTGIAHLLAVSGFHISVIIAAICFVLKKLKTNKKLEFCIVGAIVVFYAYLCEFSVSVIRAGIMSLVLLYAGIRNKEYDRLNSLSLAACLILLVNPLDAFNISFVLSFVAVLSIILLMQPLERLLNKIFYKKFASSLALCLSVSFGMSMFQLYYFGSIPVLSFLANMVTVPLVSAMFVYLLVVVVFAPLFNISAPLISLYGFGMKYILQFNNLISEVGFKITAGAASVVLLPLSLILMFILSDYVFIKPKHKAILSGGLAVAIVLLLVI